MKQQEPKEVTHAMQNGNNKRGVTNVGSENSNVNSDNNNASTENNPDGKLVGDNTVKDPDDWTTGDEPMTGAQSSYLQTLASEAGESVAANLTKAAASKKIEELQQKTGRGLKGQGENE